MRSIRKQMPAAAGVAGACLALPADAFAHAADRGHVLLLPTTHYLVGGAMAVALSFLVLAFLPAAPLGAWFLARSRPIVVPAGLRLWTSAASLAVLALLLLAGWTGSNDPLSNPLPLTVWTVFWVGLTLFQGVFGNLWWWIDPWYAPSALYRRLAGPVPEGRAAMLPRAGYWPAIVLFIGFAWFELVDPAPDQPGRLALVLAVYWCLNLAAVCAFGHAGWLRQGECLSAFLAMIARLGICEGNVRSGRMEARLRFPGAGLVAAPILPLSGTLFLVLALSTVSFDGLMRTFFWMDVIGINPLDFPGRSLVVRPNTAGLLASFAALAALFLASIALGRALAGGTGRLTVDAGRLVWSIIPISLAYHFSHYLTALVVNGQYALASYSDPFSRGWDLFGTAEDHIHAGVVMGAHSAWVIWNLQAAAIIGGHLMAVVIAHVVAFDIHGSERRASRSQAVLALVMVGYTVFGLWLLSSPTAA